MYSLCDQDFIIVLHKSGILLYNTLKGQWWQIEVSNEENKIDFCEHTYEYYYIRKCNKVAFVLLDKEANFDDCIMIDLNLIENSEKNYVTRLSESYIRYRDVIPYVKSTYGDFYSNTNVAFRDYSLDAKKGVLYVSYRLGNYEIKHIAMECNLCSSTYRWEEFRIDVPLQWGKQHDANANTPTYISRRHLAMKGMPKYLPMYSMRSLYEVIMNKISQHELVIRKKIISIKTVESPYSGLKKRIPIISLCIMDSRFNRNTTLYRKIASFGEQDRHGKIFVMSPYQDIVGIYNLLENQMHNELYMIGIIVINELIVVSKYEQK